MVTLQAGRRITLPKDVCDRAGFSPGDCLEVQLADFPGALQVRKKGKVIEDGAQKKPRGDQPRGEGAPKE